MWIFQSLFFFFKQKTAYEMRISDWSSDVCSSDLHHTPGVQLAGHFCRESLVAPAKQQGKHMGVGVRKLGSAHHVGMGIEPENAQLFTISAASIRHRPKLEQAVDAQRHAPYGRMHPDGLSRRCGSRQAGGGTLGATANAPGASSPFRKP